jgi:selenocysteine-specific elongation factor
VSRPLAPRPLVVGTAGHIDHGKSSLVQALTGTNPDRLKEEQARGITIDLGFAHADLDGVDVSFVDVPGHERFVRNMLAGAGGIDAALLVVAADESVMPQTREHAEICRLLDIPAGVVAITKADLADPDMLALVELDVRELLRGSRLAQARVVPVSVRTGQGLPDVRAALSALADVPRPASRDDVVRLPVDRVFTMRGHGTVITGTLVSGTIAEGQELSVLPSARRVRVRGIQQHGRAVPAARAPGRVALNLSGVETDELARGMTIAPADALAVTRRIDARIELLPGASPLRHGARVRVHQGTAEAAARVLIGAAREHDEASWRLARPGELRVTVPAGGHAYVRLRLDQPVAITRGDRFVLRAQSPAVTIGGGIVLDPEPPGGGLRREAALARFVDLETIDGALARWVTTAAGMGLAVPALVSRGGLPHADAERAAGRALASARCVRIGDRLYDAPLVAQLGEAVTAHVRAFHGAHPLETGVPREALRDAAAPHATAELFDHVMTALARDGVMAGSDRIALAGHEVVLSDTESRTRGRILDAVRAAGLAGADAASLAAAAGHGAAGVDRVAHLLVRQKELVKIESLFFDAAALQRLKEDVHSMRGAAGTAPVRIDVATFKSRYGLTRKSAIPLLEWLDRERVTRRMGEARVIL